MKKKKDEDKKFKEFIKKAKAEVKKWPSWKKVFAADIYSVSTEEFK
jgi:hypothetical protein